MQKKLVITSTVKSKINNVDYVFKSNSLILDYTQKLEPDIPKKRNIIEIDAPYFPQENNNIKNCRQICCKPNFLCSRQKNNGNLIQNPPQNQKFSHTKNTQNFECLLALLIKFFH